MNYHLVILKKPYLDSILAGQKTIESRFTRTKRPPFGQVASGDMLFLKESCGPVVATATAEAVKYLENLCPMRINKIRQQYNDKILADNQYWLDKAGCRFGILIWLQNVQPTSPVRIDKKDLRGWVVLSEKESFGLPIKNQK